MLIWFNVNAILQLLKCKILAVDLRLLVLLVKYINPSYLLSVLALDSGPFMAKAWALGTGTVGLVTQWEVHTRSLPANLDVIASAKFDTPTPTVDMILGSLTLLSLLHFTGL